jgi:aspartate carbamoyltransferase catalytic subunit
MSQPFGQLDAGGRLRHLLTLDGLPRSLVESLLQRAADFAAKPGRAAARGEAPAGRTVVNLFGEPSTRTRASFELAALRLGGDVLNLDNALSSRAKGETLLDTVHTLLAMQADVFVIRDAEAGVPERVAREVDAAAAVVSAGEAHLSHPTQGLLDALTIREHKGDFAKLAVAIVGDIARSRVARSAHRVLATLGAREIRVVAPRAMMPGDSEFAGARRVESLDEGIADADVVMMLRIQHERAGGGPVDLAAYHRDFGLTAARLARAAPEAIVMHPGPMNRGVEIDSEVADGPQSVIRRQVANGVAVRMAVLEHLAAARRPRAA